MEDIATPSSETVDESSAKIVKKKRKIRLVYSSDKKRKIKCPGCSVRLTKQALALHWSSHHGNDAFQCILCSKLFLRPTSVKQHIRRFHPGMDVKAYRTQRKEELPSHVQEELKNRIRANWDNSMQSQPSLTKLSRFNCYDCDGSFTSAGDLFKHCETHRVLETGQVMPYLIPISKRWQSSNKKWVYK